MPLGVSKLSYSSCLSCQSCGTQVTEDWFPHVLSISTQEVILCHYLLTSSEAFCLRSHNCQAPFFKPRLHGGRILQFCSQQAPVMVTGPEMHKINCIGSTLILVSFMKNFFWDKWPFNSYLNVLRGVSIAKWKHYWDVSIRKVY